MPGVQTRVSLSWGGQSHSGTQASVPASPRESLRVPEDTGRLRYLHPLSQPLFSSNGVSLLRPVLRLPGASYTENHLKDVWAATFMVTLYIQGPKESSNDGPVDVLIGWWGSISGHVTLSEFSIRSYEMALSLQIRLQGWAASFCSSPLPFYP